MFVSRSFCHIECKKKSIYSSLRPIIEYLINEDHVFEFDLFTNEMGFIRIKLVSRF